MKKSVKIGICILVALVLGSAIGVGSAIWTYQTLATLPNRAIYTKNGPWVTNLTAGNEKADMYTRAYIAVHGSLTLNKDEVIYYSASRDDSNKPLTADSDYRIEGKVPDASWWSITVYGSDDFLIPNELKRYSFHSRNVTYDQSGRFIIYVSKTQKPGNWLPLGDQKKFTLALRLYNPGDTIKNNPAADELPHIVKE